MRIKLSRVLPFLLVSSVLSGCATTSSTGDAPLNQGNWPLCSAIGALAGGGLGAIESSTWAPSSVMHRTATKMATVCSTAVTAAPARQSVLR